MGSITIRPLTPADRADWQPLWQGYQTFYNAKIPAETTELTWQRFFDPALPIHALGAFDGARLVGIVHYLFHLTTWTSGPYCYLQDLFSLPDVRGQGVGRALIAAVQDAARDAGASRVYWLTHETNTTAMRLYDDVADRTGFVQYRQLLG